jgi:hypothetical protein
MIFILYLEILYIFVFLIKKFITMEKTIFLKWFFSFKNIRVRQKITHITYVFYISDLQCVSFCFFLKTKKQATNQKIIDYRYLYQ